MMYKFKLKASQFILNSDFKWKFADRFKPVKPCFLRLISTIGGPEKDFSASIKRPILVEETVSIVFKGSLLPVEMELLQDCVFSIFRNCRRTPT